VLDGRGRPATSWAGFWPRQARCTGHFGSLPVGCWAESPGRSNEAVVGQNFLAGQNENVLHGNLYHFVLMFFRTNKIICLERKVNFNSNVASE
jgi:hypothetical protein